MCFKVPRKFKFLEPVEQADFKAVRVKALPQVGNFLYFNSGTGRLGLIYPQLGGPGCSGKEGGALEAPLL